MDRERSAFRHLAERQAFGNAEHALSGLALPGSFQIVPGWGAVANAARHLAGKVLIPRVAPIGLQLVQSFIAGKVLGLPKSY